MSKEKQVPNIRSGPAEYLMFGAVTGKSGINIIIAVGHKVNPEAPQNG